MERFVVMVMLAGMSMGTPSTTAQAEESKQLFHIESRSQKAGPAPGSIEVTYEMVNASSQRVTAWDFGCVDISQEGTGGLSSTSSDGYWAVERAAEAGMAVESRVVVEPKGKVERTVVFDPSELAGPFAARTCGPLIAIFEDTTFEGPEDLAAAHFSRRAQEAIDARRARGELERRIGRGWTLKEAVESLSPASGGGPLEGFRQVLERGDQLSIDIVVHSLDQSYAWAMRHLPATWQAQVEEKSK